MPGYRLIEQKDLDACKTNGIPAFAEEIGILDFLRELNEDEVSFAKCSELRVVGLEDVLFAARPDERELAFEIRRRLKKAAQQLESRLVSVQVTFNGSLKRGETLWVEYRKARLPIDLIFGSPLRQTDGHGNPYYPENFGLT